MRAAIFPLATAVALSGCASTSPGWGDDSYGPGSWRAGHAGERQGVALHADVWYSAASRDVSFRVSRPAYVAIFQITPGYGTRMLYPQYGGEDNYVREGYHRLGLGWGVRTIGWGSYGGWGGYGGWDVFFVGLGNLMGWDLYPQGYNYGNPWGYRYGSSYHYGAYGTYRSTPTYLFLVASSEPLRTDRFLSRALHSFDFASFAPYAVMDRLTDTLVRYPLSADWTTAVYVIWPRQRTYLASYPSYYRYACWDGRVVHVRVGFYPSNRCRYGPPPQVGDSTGTTPPPDTGEAGVITIPMQPWMPVAGPGQGGTLPWPGDGAVGEGEYGEGPGGTTAVPGLRLPIGAVEGPGKPAGGQEAEWPDPPEQMDLPTGLKPTVEPPGGIPSAPRPTPVQQRPPQPWSRPSPQRPVKPTPPPRPTTRPSLPPRPDAKPSPPPRPSSRPSPPPRPSSRPSPSPRPTSRPSPPPRPSSRPSPPPRPPNRPSRPPPKPRDPPPRSA